VFVEHKEKYFAKFENKDEEVADLL